jgi:colanic acid/amylovoran biosynthesis glycosyltransferase
MNILIYTPDAFKISETFIQNQFKFQTKHNLIGLCHKKNDNLPYSLIKIPAIPKNKLDRFLSFLQKKIYKLYKSSFSVFTEKQILNIIKQNKIDVIHCNYGTNALKFIHIIRKTNIPFIVHFHGFDASNSLLDEDYRNMLPVLFNLSTYIVVVSQDMKKRIMEITHQKDKEKIQLIPYGVDIKTFSNIDFLKDNDKIKLLHVGRITPKKGVPDLLKVYNEIIKENNFNAELHIIGDGEEYNLVEKFVSDYELKVSVILHGALPHPDVLEHMKSADIFILNSRIAPDGDREGYPNVIIEAMASETAIVSTYHAGIPDAVSHEKEGLLVEEKNNEQLKQAIIRLLKNKEERVLYAKNAKERAFKEFSVEKMIDAYNKLYESI